MSSDKEEEKAPQPQPLEKKKLNCPVGGCPFFSERRNNLKQHLRSHNLSEDSLAEKEEAIKKPLKICTVCQEVFDQTRKLKSHLKKHTPQGLGSLSLEKELPAIPSILYS